MHLQFPATKIFLTIAIFHILSGCNSGANNTSRSYPNTGGGDPEISKPNSEKQRIFEASSEPSIISINQSDSDLGNSRNDQCKKILRAINRRNASYSLSASSYEPPTSQGDIVPIEPDKQQENEKFLMQYEGRYIKHLDAMIRDIQAVELNDSQLKTIQAQLVRAYKLNYHVFSSNTPDRIREISFPGSKASGS
jgi:hypothetical protein